jgi:hypothetical protein
MPILVSGAILLGVSCMYRALRSINLGIIGRLIMFLMSGTRRVEVLAVTEKGPAEDLVSHRSADEIQDRARILESWSLIQ